MSKVTSTGVEYRVHYHTAGSRKPTTRVCYSRESAEQTLADMSSKDWVVGAQLEIRETTISVEIVTEVE